MLSLLHALGSSSPRAMTGFDLLLGKIHAVHRAINLGMFSLDAETLERSAVNAAAAVRRKVKSSFTKELGKIMMVDDIGVTLSATRCAFRVVASPSSMSATTTFATSTSTVAAQRRWHWRWLRRAAAAAGSAAAAEQL